MQIENERKPPEGICGNFEIGKSKPHWVFLVFTDDAKWEVVHDQYYTLVQSQVHSIHFEYDFIHPNPQKPTDPIELAATIERYAKADLIFVLNEHDFLNIGNLLNIDTICNIYNRTANHVLCLRQKIQHLRFQPAAGYVSVEGFKPNRNIPKLEIHGKWYNCGPEWLNPIVFRPMSHTHESYSPESIQTSLLDKRDYVRCNKRDEFAPTERNLPPKYFILSIPETFAKLEKPHPPPGFSVIPTGACTNNSLVVIVKSGR